MLVPIMESWDVPGCGHRTSKRGSTCWWRFTWPVLLLSLGFNTRVRAQGLGGKYAGSSIFYHGGSANSLTELRSSEGKLDVTLVVDAFRNVSKRSHTIRVHLPCIPYSICMMYETVRGCGVWAGKCPLHQIVPARFKFAQPQYAIL